MHADLIARSRTGDRVAFGGLVGLWADQALQVALQAARDPEDAGDAVARAFVQAYTDLPNLHRTVAVRPWLMMLVLESCGAPPRDERLRLVLDRKGPLGARNADRALATLLGEPPKLRLPSTFFEDRVEPSLADPAEAAISTKVADVEVGWLIATTVATLAAASGMTMRSVTRIGAKGRGACLWPVASTDVLEVNHRSPRRLGWTVRSRARIVPGEVQVSYDAMQLEDAIAVRLRGVAIPTGAASRLSAKMAAASNEHRLGALQAAWDRIGPVAP